MDESSARNSEINQLASLVVKNVIKSAKEKVEKEQEEMIKRKALQIVSDTICNAKTKADREEIKKSAFELVNQVLKEVAIFNQQNRSFLSTN